MNQALQLGFRTFINLSSFAAGPRNFGIGRLAPLRGKGMGSKRRSFSNSSSVADQNIDKKLKGVIDNDNPISDKPFLKDIMDDPSKIEAMTVQQLRTALRTAGIPIKGLKRDLVSALQSYLAKEIDGESSLLTDKQDPFNSDDSISLRVEERAIEDQVQDVNTTPEVCRVQRSTRTVKQLQIKGETVEVDAKIVSIEQKLSVKTDRAAGRKPSQTKRKVSSDLYSNNVRAENRVTPPVNQNEPWTIIAHKKPQKGWIAYNPRTMRRPPSMGNTKVVKVLSWNVNGLRALLKVEGFPALELAKRENFDVLCLQETKLQEKDVESVKQSLIEGYENSFWTCSHSKLGYSGTAIISRIKPLSVRYGLGISDHDSEGRVVTAEFDTFYLLSVYVPNSGDGLKRLTYRITEWDPSLSNYIKELEKSKPVILTGDLNCAHEEIDIHDPAGNKRSAGFTIEERQSFGTNFLSKGFVDTFRKQHPGVVGYTYWGYRHGARKTNKGWRLDYFLVSEAIADDVHDSYILPDVMGSDHCPIGLTLKV
ncbi:DNA-(apurinic or apyrimidinic site) lyase, chloroplastic isoform X2 [Durio zibethinus]|uniref:DNA-(apurinic or apyrimidinic site) endonuclease n=1 Tax=Durio zibethinus TaxID=66656 RepID=A0A6P5YTL4_DURZI|nr:DNA-(apurinic or apyrimidinic site) lyase, chloroplastic isoform X2 [Durio zibethinus]